MRYKATFKCEETCEGWGRKGTIKSIGSIEAKNFKEALNISEEIHPKNWRVIKIEEDIRKERI